MNKVYTPVSSHPKQNAMKSRCNQPCYVDDPQNVRTSFIDLSCFLLIPNNLPKMLRSFPGCKPQRPLLAIWKPSWSTSFPGPLHKAKGEVLGTRLPHDLRLIVCSLKSHSYVFSLLLEYDLEKHFWFGSQSLVFEYAFYVLWQEWSNSRRPLLLNVLSCWSAQRTGSSPEQMK